MNILKTIIINVVLGLSLLLYISGYYDRVISINESILFLFFVIFIIILYFFCYTFWLVREENTDYKSWNKISRFIYNFWKFINLKITAVIIILWLYFIDYFYYIRSFYWEFASKYIILALIFIYWVNKIIYSAKKKEIKNLRIIKKIQIMIFLFIIIWMLYFFMRFIDNNILFSYKYFCWTWIDTSLEDMKVGKNFKFVYYFICAYIFYIFPYNITLGFWWKQ